MPIETRYDRGRLAAPTFREDGAAVLEGFVARPGILEYRRNGELVRELVPVEELSDPASVETLDAATVTLGHPPDWISPDNVGEHQVGDTSRPRVDGGMLAARVVVRRRDALEALRAGTRELSAGYTLDYDPTPGVHPEFGPYDGVQRRRRYNHVAIVPVGRAGSAASLRIDEADALGDVPACTSDGDSDMDEIDEIKAALEAATQRADAAESNLAGVTRERDTLQARVDADTAESRAVARKRRARLDSLAAAFKLDDTIELDDADLERAILKAANGEVDETRLDSADYRAAALDFVKVPSAEDKWQRAGAGLAAAEREDSASTAEVTIPNPFDSIDAAYTARLGLEG